MPACRARRSSRSRRPEIVSGPTRPSVQQHHQQRSTTAGLEVLAGADGEQRAELRLGNHRDGLVGTAGGFIFAMGLGSR
jgi:hypothetical protein